MLDEKNLTNEEIEWVNNHATIIRNYLGNNNIVASWGAWRWKACVFQGMAALRFHVDGFLHSGWVIVAYDYGDDTYKVFCQAENGDIMNERSEVYAGQLIETIDNMVETTNENDSEYKAKAIRFFKDTLSGESFKPGYNQNNPDNPKE